MGLGDELSQLIAAYCDKKGHSLTTLSKESGVPYGSVKRIAQSESLPELHNTLKLLMILIPRAGECYAFLRRHFQDVSDFLERVNFTPGERKLRDALRDKVSFYIIHLASTRGTSYEEIAREFGNSGLMTLEYLLQEQIVFKEGAKIIADDFSITDIDTTLQQMSFLIQDFQSENLGNKQSLASLQVLCLNQDGVRAVYQSQKKFIEELLTIKENFSSNGDKVVFIATLFNNLWKPAIPSHPSPHTKRDDNLSI